MTCFKPARIDQILAGAKPRVTLAEPLMESKSNGRTIPFVESGSYPVRSGNSLRPLIDGEPAFSRILEAIDSAHRSIWVTVTFMWASFQMPDGRGSALDVLEHAAVRGLDIRLLCWRPDPETEHFKTNAFWGSPDHFDRLRTARGRIRLRWDRALPGFCQHQKSWLIDAGQNSEIAFVGGINLNPHSMVAPGHRGSCQNHDVYLELTGPSTVDVHHNFVQRWNEASERNRRDGCWESDASDDLLFPTAIPAGQGSAVVQIQRTMPRGRYIHGDEVPGGVAFNIGAGERSNLDQYRAAIDAARHSIYLEQQHIDEPELIGALARALQRGVEIVTVMPAEQPISCDLSRLAHFENWTLAGIAGLDIENSRRPVWVHSKLMIVDDVWATIGSCNLHRASLLENAELNAAFWHPTTARVLRCALFEEHLNRDTSNLDDRSALKLFRKIAKANRTRFQTGEISWQGLAFSLLPESPHGKSSFHALPT